MTMRKKDDWDWWRVWWWFTIFVYEGHIGNSYNVDGATPNGAENGAKNLFHGTNTIKPTHKFITSEMGK